ncbi:M24 family metallopeptidase [Salipaludibacillus daqingensis]|uniref:M24 family metallopeptidase n=1 Tax=Salipaludibacillus daqingensis TaxID=3041001 RepID=UPI00247316AD|nr:Xaa-Pro peptidase family protein [Salipaludibacillus daqingensis]
MSKRIQYIKEKLIKTNADALMVQTRANVFYLSGFDTNPHERLVAVFVFKNEDPLLICPNMEVNQVKDIFNSGAIIGYSDTESPWEKLQDYLQTKGIKHDQLAIESTLSWDRMKAWQKINKDVSFLEADPYLNELRVIKDETEITILKEAAELADRGIKAGIKALHEGVTEMEVLATIEYSLKKIGIREMSFSTMVLFGEKAGDPHGNPGDRELQKGDAVLFDLGVVWKGYCSDITRTVFFDHVKDDDKKIYDTVLKAQNKALTICKPGEPISSLDKTARNEIANAGFGSYFPHRIGHGLGIDVHEFPSLNDKNASQLMKGMTFTIEPGVYIPNQAGVRIEDDVLITSDGYETLTKFPKELTIVPYK